MKTLLFVLLLGSTAAAQPFLGMEVKSSPIEELGEGATVSQPPPLIAPNGDSFAALLRLPSQTDVMLFGPTSDVRQTLPVTILTEAAISGNGSSVLVVWTGPPLQGIVIDSNGHAAAPFTISQSSVDHPKVVATGSNDFVVFYRIHIGSGQKALAGRIVHLQPARHRAIK